VVKDLDSRIKVITRFDTLIEPRKEGVLLLKQEHGAVGFERHQSDLRALDRPVGDWHWTREPNLCLGILVADCTAIMISGLSSVDGLPFVAALHAGWRGTAAGIIETFHSVVRPSPGWMAWLSPSICENHFEVGPEVLEALGEVEGQHRRSENIGKFFLNLKQHQIARIEKLGGKIESDWRCTFCDPALISYRQSGAQLTKRHISEISFDLLDS
jgi:copper oxidase (laccase) domain-containing protein